MADLQPGDKVVVLGGNVQVDDGLNATVVRRMPESDDFEVEYDEEQPGLSPMVHVNRLRLVTADGSVSETAPEVAPAAEEATPEAAADEGEQGAN